MSCPVTERAGGPIRSDGILDEVPDCGDMQAFVWMRRAVLGCPLVMFVSGGGEVEPIPGFPVSFTTDSGAGSLCLL
ncbi:MAG: hypothetical protein IPH13_20375 [Planctomycetes bacterium]|nr:hypothetical protein [Planctomycetota bacterium]